jgi:hypothetical protein
MQSLRPQGFLHTLCSSLDIPIYFTIYRSIIVKSIPNFFEVKWPGHVDGAHSARLIFQAIGLPDPQGHEIHEADVHIFARTRTPGRSRVLPTGVSTAVHKTGEHVPPAAQSLQQFAHILRPRRPIRLPTVNQNSKIFKVQSN